MYFTGICQIVKPSFPPNSIFFIHLMEENIHFDMAKFLFFTMFWKFYIFDFDVEIVWKEIKLIYFRGQDLFLLLINKNKKKYFTSILTPSTNMTRFLIVFLKDDLQGKIKNRNLIRLRTSVHFDRFALFKFFLSWWETFGPFKIFVYKVFRIQVATFELTLFNLNFFRLIIFTW